MRQFVHRGPEIPSEVLYALEESRLVFFCGAGISVYTGLPDFKQLTVDAFAASNVPLAADGELPREPWDHAFRGEKFDKALGLLEQAATPGSMRRNVIKLLSAPIAAKLSDGPHIHRALLDLSRYRDGGHSLVTSNFDDRFVLAGLPDNRCHAAPRLAPPRREEWRHLTYLHGRIDRDLDPDGRGLVLTSADFGKAYLRDGWAARFVVELFREFTVLFIGYGLNDPAMAYLIDALAADMAPKGQFKKAFALAGYRDDGKDRDVQRKLWRAKNVELIPVNTGSKPRKRDYRLLEATILEWARYHRGGLDSREADALTNTSRPFVPGNDDQEVKKVAWALSEADGIVARKFAEADPAPNISWLKPLSEVDIPKRDSDTVFRLFHHPARPPRNDGDMAGKGLAPLAGWHAVCEQGLPLAPVPFQLARWLVQHLDKRELVEWIVEQGGRIHPKFADEIERGLAGRPDLPAPFRSFWELVIRGAFGPRAGIENLTTSRVVLKLKQAQLNDLAPIERHWLLAAGKSYLSARRPLSAFRPEADGQESGRSLHDLAWLDLEIADGHAVKEFIEAIATSETAARVASELADDITSLLLQAVRLGEAAELSTTLNHSYCALPSISEHDQNEHAPDWTLLVLLCRTAFDAAVGRNELAAHALVRRWIALWSVNGYSVFRRLALYAYATRPALTTGDALELVLDRGVETLWSDDCRREVLQLLKRRGAAFAHDQLGELVAAILKGPPESWFPREADSAERERYSRREIAVRLGKLAQAGAPLEGDAKTNGEDHRKRLDEETLRTERDEFLIWSGGLSRVAPPTAADLLQMTPCEAADEIMRIENSWKAGEKLVDLVSKNRSLALDVMDQLAEKGERRADVWNHGISSLSPVQAIEEFRTIAERLRALLDSYSDLALLAVGGLASWLASTAESLPPDSENEGLFLDLWRMTWNASLTVSLRSSARPSQ